MSTEDSSCGCDTCRCSTEAGDEASTAPLPWESGDSFHPIGKGWEKEMRAMLDDTEYDTDLGMEMAEDAMRLVAGEITEEEFHTEYHDAVTEEFGTDDRPLPNAFSNRDGDVSLAEHLEKLVDGDISRRETMKKMGLGAAAVGLGSGVFGGSGEDEDPTFVDTEAAQEDENDGTQWGMVIDLERCDGCLQCVIGCMEENNTSTGANWMYVLTYEDERTEEENFLVRPCQHCSNAPCAKVCPVEARHIREEGGMVLTDYETCIGCRYCQVACPYGVNYFQWGEPDTPLEDIERVDVSTDDLQAMDAEERRETLEGSGDHFRDGRGREVDSRPRKGTMGKCTFCPSRQDGNMGEDAVGTVACMDACDAAGMSAIHFGDMNDPESRPNRYLERRREVEPRADEKFEDPEEEWEEAVTGSPESQLSAYKLLEEIGTEPNVVYLGNEPGPEAEQVEGPVAYEDIGTVDRRKDHLDLGAAANEED
ncbi:4Fe-4S dicluster domain-containing protein [Halobacteria archaeon AArc-curdl1]|uniref:4Fe-4S dicluster domain-containing protein n=1 Tax=Natronosalvus hydrolyticus TaxID=2979988 RepID=A0AAP2Z6X0_9EURY|nr:4Fe-4S dicluster domain-containing protein [Halobacteria archaeon AArc-curdl1]